MRKLWLPEPIYEMKPYGALAIGLLALLLGAARSWATQDWDLNFAAAAIIAAIFVLYGAAILRMRHVYRGRSRWHRERRP